MQSQPDKRGFLSTPAANPQGPPGTVAAYIPYAKALHYQKYGPAHKFHELLHLVRETLVDPACIYPYIADDFRGYCYTRRATYTVTNHGTRVDPPDGSVYAVFLTDSMKVTDWGWEDHDRDEPNRPLIHVERLESPIWTKTT